MYRNEMNHNILIIDRLEFVLVGYIQTKQSLGTTVDTIYSLIQEFEEPKPADFFAAWEVLEGVYASTHFTRDYHTGRETSLVCAGVLALYKAMRTYKNKCSGANDIATHKATDFGDEVIVLPFELADVTKLANIRWLVELGLQVDLYVVAKCSLTDLIDGVFKLVREIARVSIDAFVSVARALEQQSKNVSSIEEELHTFEQTAIICRCVVVLVRLIEQHKQLYGDPYASERYQKLLQNWPEEAVSCLQRNELTVQMREYNKSIVMQMLEQIDWYKHLSYSLETLVQELERGYVNMALTQSPGLVDQIMRLTIIIKRARSERRAYFFFDETAIIYGTLSLIEQLLIAHKSELE